MNKKVISVSETASLLRIFLISVTLNLIIACDDDRKVQPPLIPQLGYEGEYSVIFAGQSDGDSVLSQWIEWVFSDMKFWMYPNRTYEQPRIFCDVIGNYKLSDSITFSNLIVDSDSCNAKDLPVGTFSFRKVLRNAEIDSIIMVQAVDTITKEIRLARR